MGVDVLVTVCFGTICFGTICFGYYVRKCTVGGDLMKCLGSLI
jgi:hypothetical protein